MRFDVVGSGGSEEARMPSGQMRSLEHLRRAQRQPPLGPLARVGDLRRAVTIAGNGFDPMRIDVRPRLGTSELWQWHNPSNRVHPKGLHGMLFRIVERSTGVAPPRRARLEGHDRRAAGRDRDRPALVRPLRRASYVFHCHALEHGDKAMMLQLEVVRMRRLSVP